MFPPSPSHVPNRWLALFRPSLRHSLVMLCPSAPVAPGTGNPYPLAIAGDDLYCARAAAPLAGSLSGAVHRCPRTRGKRRCHHSACTCKAANAPVPRRCHCSWGISRRRSRRGTRPCHAFPVPLQTGHVTVRGGLLRMMTPEPLHRWQAPRLSPSPGLGGIVGGIIPLRVAKRALTEPPGGSALSARCPW